MLLSNCCLTPPNRCREPSESLSRTLRIVVANPPNRCREPSGMLSRSPTVSVSGVEGSVATRDTRHPTLRATREKSWPHCCARNRPKPLAVRFRFFLLRNGKAGTLHRKPKSCESGESADLFFPKLEAAPRSPSSDLDGKRQDLPSGASREAGTFLADRPDQDHPAIPRICVPGRRACARRSRW